MLVTYAANAPEVVGMLLPLDKPLLTLGRGRDQDLIVPEATVSEAHAQLRWQQGSWIVEDLGSTNGSYTDQAYERTAQLAMTHGTEAQLGECRLKLVSFGADSPAHRYARHYLGKRDGLTSLLTREHLLKEIDEDDQFCAWYEAPMQVCRFALLGPGRQAGDRPSTRELLALRKAAQRVVELTEMRFPSIAPVVAGRTGPRAFVVSMVGPTVDEARLVVQQIAPHAQALLPDALELVSTLVSRDPGRPARHLID
jgi:serine/threonine-protein kinase